MRYKGGVCSSPARSCSGRIAAPSGAADSTPSGCTVARPRPPRPAGSDSAGSARGAPPAAAPHACSAAAAYTPCPPRCCCSWLCRRGRIGRT
eukprot:scaffold8530_cov60-Phaeocystis_antarctica.AAC.2